MLNIDRFIEKMNNRAFCLGVNLWLAIGIFLCNILGRSMGIQQGSALAISVVWPATGLSLAILLLFGYRASLGIFVGNFAYNLLFLIHYPHDAYLTTSHKIIAATLISMGSLTQSLISASIIQLYSTAVIFRTVQDIFIFLIPAGILSCLISSTIGVVSLSVAGGLTKSLIIPVWLTFLLGDTVGIYVITPLIIIWTLRYQKLRFSDHIPALILMTFIFLLLAFAAFWSGHTFPHLFLPLSISAAYLFRMYGASLVIFLMTGTSIAFAAVHGAEGTSLITLITYIGVTVAASLIIAAVANEREEAWALLDSRNLYLEKEVDVKMEVLKHVRSEISQKRKFATRGMVSKLLTVQIPEPLNQIERIAKTSSATLQEIQTLFEKQNNLSPEQKVLLQEKLHLIDQGLSEILDSQKRIAELFRFLNI